MLLLMAIWMMFAIFVPASCNILTCNQVAFQINFAFFMQHIMEYPYVQSVVFPGILVGRTVSVAVWIKNEQVETLIGRVMQCLNGVFIHMKL